MIDNISVANIHSFLTSEFVGTLLVTCRLVVESKQKEADTHKTRKSLLLFENKNLLVLKHLTHFSLIFKFL